MTSVDIVLVLIIAGAFVLGFLWGVIRSLLMLAAWFVVFVLSAILSVPARRLPLQPVELLQLDWNHMAAFAILYVGGLIIALVVAWVGVRGPQGVTKYRLFG